MRLVLCLETVSVWISKWDCCAYNRSECVDCGSTNTWPLLKWPTNKKGIADFTILCSSCMFLRRVSMGASASAKSCWILICQKCHKKRNLRKSSKFSLSHAHSRSGTSDWKESAEKLVETECSNKKLSDSIFPASMKLRKFWNPIVILYLPKTQWISSSKNESSRGIEPRRSFLTGQGFNISFWTLLGRASSDHSLPLNSSEQVWSLLPHFSKGFRHGVTGPVRPWPWKLLPRLPGIRSGAPCSDTANRAKCCGRSP